MTTVHVYLSATVDIPCTLDFFGIKEMKVHPHTGHDEEPSPGEPAGVPVSDL